MPADSRSLADEGVVIEPTRLDAGTLRDLAARGAALGGPGRELRGEEADTVMRALRDLAQGAGPAPAGESGAEG